MEKGAGLLVRVVSATAFLCAAFATPARAQSAAGALSQNEIIERRILPQLEGLFQKLIAEKRDITIDGTRAFSGDDHFLPGKVALGLTHVLINTPRSDPRFATYLAGYRDIADMTVDDVNDTWGIYYYMSALNKLRNGGPPGSGHSARDAGQASPETGLAPVCARAGIHAGRISPPTTTAWRSASRGCGC